MQTEPDFWPHIGLLDYHLYNDPNAPERSLIRDFGFNNGIPTAMTEYYLVGGIDKVYDDFVLGGVSIWDVTTSSGTVFGSDANGVSYLDCLAHKAKYWGLRQLMHYVWPGAERIDATSDNTNLKTLAFEKGGKITVILINKTGSAQTVNGQTESTVILRNYRTQHWIFKFSSSTCLPVLSQSAITSGSQGKAFLASIAPITKPPIPDPDKHLTSD
ncbi:MAG: hypothetical protein JW841_03425 [Deltaproteobacteria bacterium]|nr:hypothetical protein [Deltaproteobacteria bacterium]